MKSLFMSPAFAIILFCLAFTSFAAEGTDIATRYAPREMAIPLTLLPRDKYGLFDWAEGVRRNIIKPISSLDGLKEEEPYASPVLIKSKREFMNDALFSHDTHTYWLSCNNCHPGIFVQAMGGNPDMTMWKIFKGEYCGRCHDKVAFPLRECYRCHLDYVPRPQYQER